MPTVLHIFCKDARRLWKEIAVSWVLLGWLTRMDSWRSGAVPGAAEGWLNVLLPLAWSYLIALSLLQDPLPGERQFWLTLPVRRSAILAAKVLFAVVTIHLPYLISCAIVLQARGFPPVAYLPELFARQGLLLLVLTVPSLALASVARNAMQFILLALAIAAAAVLVAGNTGAFWPFYDLGQTIETTRRNLSLILPILASLAILWLQYRDRRTLLARGAGAAALIASAALFLLLSSTSILSVEAALRPLRPAPAATVRLSDQPRALIDMRRRQLGTGIVAAIPVNIAGAAPPDMATQLALEIEAPGVHSSTDLAPGAARGHAALIAEIAPSGDLLVLTFDRDLYRRIAHVPVTLKGHLLIQRSAANVWTGLQGFTRTDIPHMGKCAATESQGSLFQTSLFRVACESPDHLPANRIAVVDTATGRKWDERLNSSRTPLSWPVNTWLSPLDRGEFYLMTVAGDASEPGQGYRVPYSTLNHFRVDFQTSAVTGRSVVTYELRGIELSRFAVPR